MGKLFFASDRPLDGLGGKDVIQRPVKQNRRQLGDDGGTVEPRYTGWNTVYEDLIRPTFPLLEWRTHFHRTEEVFG